MKLGTMFTAGAIVASGLTGILATTANAQSSGSTATAQLATQASSAGCGAPCVTAPAKKTTAKKAPAKKPAAKKAPAKTKRRTTTVRRATSPICGPIRPSGKAAVAGKLVKVTIVADATAVAGAAADANVANQVSKAASITEVQICMWKVKGSWYRLDGAKKLVKCDDFKITITAFAEAQAAAGNAVLAPKPNTNVPLAPVQAPNTPPASVGNGCCGSSAVATGRAVAGNCLADVTGSSSASGNANASTQGSATGPCSPRPRARPPRPARRPRRARRPRWPLRPPRPLRPDRRARRPPSSSPIRGASASSVSRRSTKARDSRSALSFRPTVGPSCRQPGRGPGLTMAVPLAPPLWCPWSGLAA